MMWIDLRKILRYAVPVMLAWEVISSLCSIWLHIKFDYFALGDFTIYCATGFALARRRGLLTGPLGSASIAAVDASIGWTISWLIGPGRPATGWEHPAVIIGTSITVVVIAAIMGVIAGVVGAFFRMSTHTDQ